MTEDTSLMSRLAFKVLFFPFVQNLFHHLRLREGKSRLLFCLASRFCVFTIDEHTVMGQRVPRFLDADGTKMLSFGDYLRLRVSLSWSIATLSSIFRFTPVTSGCCVLRHCMSVIPSCSIFPPVFGSISAPPIHQRSLPRRFANTKPTGRPTSMSVSLSLLSQNLRFETGSIVA